MQHRILCSGSSGNATVISYNNQHILIDCGVGKKNLAKLLDCHCQLQIADISACFFTHSHGDHLFNKTQLLSLFAPEKLFALPATFVEVTAIEALKEYRVGEFLICTIPLSHDVPTIGFVIIAGGQKLVYITDTGYVNQRLFPLIENADIYLIESNYDEDMLFSSGRSMHLIKRILGSDGHLSNEECGDVLNCVIGPRTTEIVLMHISKDCNKRSLALQSVKECLRHNQYLANIKISASSRLEEAFVYREN